MTGDTWANFPTAAYLSLTTLGDDLVTPLREQLVQGAIDLYGDGGTLGADPVVFTASSATLSLVASGDGYDGEGHRLSAVNAAAAWESIPFADTGATTYYVGAHYCEVPTRALVGLGGVTFYEAWTEAVGTVAAPDTVADDGDGTLTLTITTLAGPWGTGAETRPVVVWLEDPVTTTAEAVYSGTAAYTGGAVKIAVPHALGQTTISTTAADYKVALLGPTISTSDLSASTAYWYLGSVLGGSDTFDSDDQAIARGLTEISSTLDTHLAVPYLPTLRPRLTSTAGTPAGTPAFVRRSGGSNTVLSGCGVARGTYTGLLDDVLTVFGDTTGNALKCTPYPAVTPTTIASSTDLQSGGAGIGAVYVPGYGHVCAYHSSAAPNVIHVRRSTDGGATWGSAISAWDNSGIDPNDGFYTQLQPFVLRTGEIVIVAPYIDDSIGGDTIIRYVISDDNGATWDSNSGAGYDLIEGVSSLQSPVVWQDADGYVWVAAQASTTVLAYVRSAAPDSMDPTDPSSPSTIIGFGLQPLGVVADDTGPVRIVGLSPSSVWNLLSVGLEVSGATLSVVARDTHQGISSSTDTNLSGGVVVGRDGGIYVALIDPTSTDTVYVHEYDQLRQRLDA